MRWTSLIVPVLASLTTTSTPTSSCCPTRPTVGISPPAPRARRSTDRCSAAPPRWPPTGSASPAGAVWNSTSSARRAPSSQHCRPRPGDPSPSTVPSTSPASTRPTRGPHRCRPPMPSSSRCCRLTSRTMDLTEARRIVGGGAGLDNEDRFRQLDRFATRHRRRHGCHPGDHRPRVGPPRPADRHHRRRRRPRAVRLVRGQRCGAAHERARPSPITSSASTPTRTAR